MATSETMGLFQADKGSRKQFSVPWRQTLEMVFKNLKNRRGRYLLIFVSIAVVVAFFVSTLSYHKALAELRLKTDVHTMSVLQRAGVLSTNPEAEQKQRDQMVWLLILSGALCFVGVTNTMYMSVTERYQEIGTLKCLGALDSFIVKLFIIESIFIGLVGSGIGAFAGFLLMLLQVGMVTQFGLLSFDVVGRAFLFGVPTAILGGTFLTVCAAIYPTLAAAKMKPVDAMRVEI